MKSLPILKQLFEPLSPLGLWLKGSILLFITWVLGVHPFQPNWAILMTLFAAFFLVPIGFREMQKRQQDIPISDFMLVLHTPSVFLTAIGCCLPQGITAGLFIFPYVAWCGLITFKIIQKRLSIAYIMLLFSWAILAVANIWLVIARMGFQPFGFSTWILLLTTTHFHYAGFALNISLSFFLYQNPNAYFAKIISIGVIIGIFLTALGITLNQVGLGHIIESFSGIFMSFVAASVGILFLKYAANYSKTTRVLWFIGSICLILAMVLAFLYASRSFFTLSFLDIPFMQAIHGTLNALGFGTLILLGFALDKENRLIY